MAKLECRVYQHNLRWFFDVVDLDDVAHGLPELVHSDGRPADRESTAERRGEQWVKTHGDTSNGN